jgi:hypothetical protein
MADMNLFRFRNINKKKYKDRGITGDGLRDKTVETESEKNGKEDKIEE